MRSVEDVEALAPERAAQHLGREARPAHSEQDDVVDVGGGFGQLTQFAELLDGIRSKRGELVNA